MLNHHVEKTLSAKSAAALDKELMSTGGFSIDQLMELAGLSVSQAGMHVYSSGGCSFIQQNTINVLIELSEFSI